MDAYHMLLRRPWQFHKGAIHNGTGNTYNFKVKGRNYTLTPSPLNQTRTLKPASGRETLVRKPCFLLKRGWRDL